MNGPRRSHLLRSKSGDPVIRYCQRLGLVGFASLALTACGKDNPVGPPVVTSVAVTPGTDTLIALGRTRQFTAVAKDANGNPVGGVTLVWHSSNPAVATVDSTTGIVTAAANGLSLIRADAGGVIGQATLAVVQVVATVQVTPGSRSFTAVGDTQRFVAVAKDSGGAAVQGVRFLWGSSNPAVATVDTLGLATSRGSGQTTISAAGRGVPGYGAVAVNQVAAFLAFVARPDSAAAGEPFPRAVQVEIRDSTGTLVAGARNAVTLGVATTYGSLSGALTVGAVGGVATFSNVTFGGIEGSYPLRAAASGFDTVQSTAVAMTPGIADTLRYVAGAYDGVVGDTLPNVTFALYDRWGNYARNDTATVHLLVDSSEWGVHLYGPTAVHGAAGTAIFSGVSLDRPSGGVYLAATVRRVKSAPAPLFFDTLPGPLVSFSARGFTTCAVYGTRTYCWGYGGSAGLGTGDFFSDSVPTLVLASQVFTSVTVALDHTCGLTAAGEAWCWGSNTSGQVSVVPNSVQVFPVSANVGLTFTQLAAGSAFTCGLTSSQDVYCWGDNSLGQLGNGKVGGSPVLVSGGHSFQALSVGQDHACGIVAGGVAYCWGRNDVGQLGVGFTSAYDSVPTLVQGGHTFTSIAAGDRHTCGILADSTAYCWGFGGGGQLGDNALASDSMPRPVGGAHKFVALASGNGTCAIDDATHLWCWGIRQEVDYFPDGVPIDLLYSGVTAVVSGSGHQCFVATSFGGRLACLGQDNAGQLGDGRHANTVFARVVAWN